MKRKHKRYAVTITPEARATVVYTPYAGACPVVLLNGVHADTPAQARTVADGCIARHKHKLQAHEDRQRAVITYEVA